MKDVFLERTKAHSPVQLFYPPKVPKMPHQISYRVDKNKPLWSNHSSN